MDTLTSSRLALARARRGMTLADLQRLSGISSRSITAYENGRQTPTAETVAALAKALGTPVAFLKQDDLEPIPPAAASFRAASRMSAKKRDAALSAGRLAIALQDWIDERFALPPNRVPRLEEVDPETAAETVRARWGLGDAPIKNVVHTLEAHGVRVFSLASDIRDVDAFSLYWEASPFVFLHTGKSAERSRFDGLHELGHLVMHHETSPGGREAEQEANRFAAAMLMPSRSVVGANLRDARVDRILVAKHHWGGSAMALTHRLHELALLSDWGYRTACVQLSRMGYRSGEPDGAQHETSQTLTKVLAALRAEHITPRDIARDLAVTLADLQDLMFGLAPAALEGGGTGAPRQPRPKLQVISGERRS